MEQSPQDYNALKRFMAIKRHELPPPGFFDQFHARVMDRIADDLEEKRVPWWERGLLLFDSKPVLAGAYALAVAGLFVCGFGFSGILQTETADLRVGDSSMVSVPLLQPVGISAQGFGSPVSPTYPGALAVATGAPGQSRILPEPTPVGPPTFLFAPGDLSTRPVSDRPRVP